MQDIFTKVMVSVFTAIITGILGYLTSLVAKIVNDKIQTSKDKKILTNIDDLIINIVKLIYQTDVEALKKNNTFTDEEKLKAKEKASKLIISQLTSCMREYIMKNSKNLETYINDKIEATIYTLKVQKK